MDKYLPIAIFTPVIATIAYVYLSIFVSSYKILLNNYIETLWKISRRAKENIITSQNC